MGLLIISTLIGGKKKAGINIKELELRLKSIKDAHNIEVIKLAIESMLDEIEEASNLQD